MTNEEEEHLKKIKRLLDSEAETHAEPAIEPKKEDAPQPEGTTKSGASHRTLTPTPPIELDKDNMPLPRRVHEIDIEGTRVTPVAYESISRPHNTQSQPRRVPPPSLVTPRRWKIDLSNIDLRRGWGCLLRAFVFVLFTIVILAIIAGSALVTATRAEWSAL